MENDKPPTLADLNNKSAGVPYKEPAKGVYKTQNQRYMHIVTSGSVKVNGIFMYSHFAGVWSAYFTGSGGSPVLVGQESYKVVDIYGADMVSIITGSTGKVFLGFSTF